MKLSIRRLREVIRKSLAGSQPDETYSMELMDDPAFSEKSVHVPDDIKKKNSKMGKRYEII